MAWLSGYSKRKKLTLDHTKADSDLPWFPVPAPMGTAVGLTDADLTEIFNDIGDNFLKIAVTKSDGTTQLYVEIEYWSAANLKALPWLSKSDWTMLSAEDTEVYFYWDSTAADNTTYVGTPGNRPEVWSFVESLLFNDSPVDSAGNQDGQENNGVVYADGKHGRSVSLDGAGAHIKVPTNSAFDGMTSAAFFGWTNLESLAGGTAARSLFCCYNGSSSRLHLKFEDDGLRLYYDIGGSSGGADAYSLVSAGVWYRVVFAIENGSWNVYLDGNTTPVISESINFDLSDLGAGWEFYVGRNFGGGDQDFKGLIDTVFADGAIPVSAWIKADYHAQTDNLITWGVTEADTVTVSGTVEEEGSGVARTVRLYLRSTGELLDETTSASDGSFSLDTIHDGEEHFIIAFDDTSDPTDYNALIYDRVVPS